MFLFPVLYISNTFLSILADPSNADFWIKVIDVSKLQRYTMMHLKMQNSVITETRYQKLFKFIDGLFKPQGVSTLPTHTSSLDLANRFMDYFSGKVNNLRSVMESPTIQLSRASLSVPSTCTFSEFGLVTQETVRTVILNIHHLNLVLLTHSRLLY